MGSFADLPSPREPIPTTGHEDETHQLRLVLTNPDPSAMRASLRSGPPGVFTMADPGVHDDRNPHTGSRVLTAAGSPVARVQAMNEEGHEARPPCSSSACARARAVL